MDGDVPNKTLLGQERQASQVEEVRIEEKKEELSVTRNPIDSIMS